MEKIDWGLAYRVNEMPEATVKWRMEHGWKKTCASGNCLLCSMGPSGCACPHHKRADYHAST